MKEAALSHKDNTASYTQTGTAQRQIQRKYYTTLAHLKQACMRCKTACAVPGDRMKGSICCGHPWNQEKFI